MPTPVLYNQFKLAQFNGGAIDFDTDTIKVAILDTGHTPSQSDDFWDDVSADEVSGTGYTAGGEATANKAVALDSSTVEFTHDDITWTQNGAGFTDGQYFVWYKDTGTPGTSRLIAYMDYGSAMSLVAADILLDVDGATGVLQF